MSEKFDFKKFVLSWTGKTELKNTFWIIFASYVINMILGGGSLAFVATIVTIYVGWKYVVNEIAVEALKGLKLKPARVGIVDYLVISVVSIIAALLPWWAGTYFIIQIIVFVAAIISMAAFYPLGVLLFLAYVLMLVHNGLRLNLMVPAYLLKRGAVAAAKTSWELTERKVVEVIRYILKSIWYTIIKTWVFLLLPAAYLLAVVVMMASGMILSAGMDFAVIGSIFVIFGVVANLSLSYSIAFGAITSQYASAAMYSIFSKR